MTFEAWRAGEVAVLGLGRSGDAASRLLRRHHLRVYASDAADTEEARSAAAVLREIGVDAQAGGHDLARIAAARAVITSPGIPPSAPPLEAARAAGRPIVSEVELALRAMPNLRYVAITGTNGKSTVTHLVALLLQSLGLAAEAVGNIGTPIAALALRPSPPEWVSLEMSSYQLHDTPGIKPDVGVLTNLSPDHLDRYPSVEAYYADKALLFRNAERASRWVVNADDRAATDLAARFPGVALRFSARGRLADAFYDRRNRDLIVLDAPLLPRGRLPLLGDHNVANALAASLAVMFIEPANRTLDARRRLADALANATPLAHRLAPVGEYDGVLWIDDSKATNVASALVGIESMERPTVLLLGGKHKGEPYTSLVEAIGRHCRAVVAYGAAAPEILRDLDGRAPVEHVGGTFSEVVARARALARHGDAVLLSPACSSFDMFLNYEDRGRQFAALASGGRG